MTLVLITILPVILLLWFVYKRDYIAKEPVGLLVLLFAVGCLSTFPATVMESLLMVGCPDVPVLSGLYRGFVVAGFSEELCKLVLLAMVVWRGRNFNEYFDGIVYAVFVSMGFACVENFLYVFGQASYGESLSTGLMRALLAVPAHFLFAVTMGYHLSFAKFDSLAKWKHLFYALFIPVLLHGTYDALLMIPETLNMPIIATALFVLFVFFDIKMWQWGMKRIRQLQILSKQQDFDRKDPFRDFIWKV